MSTVVSNPGYIMGYLVHYWDKVIKPVLEQGDFDGLEVVVLDCVMRGELTLENARVYEWRDNSYKEFRSALFNLIMIGEALRREDPNKKILKILSSSAEEYFKQMDIIMRGNEDYGAAKRGMGYNN